MQRLAKLDHRYLWHPFTQMRDWLRREPIVITSGEGAVLRDTHGREYLDANSSIWTNLHGHNHPVINAAITRQLKRISHSSALGLANEPASLVAEQLVKAVNPSPFPLWREPRMKGRRHDLQKPLPLGKVFFSDDGSTAMEVALKLCYEFARRVRKTKAPKFLSLEAAYHGDTIGAVALGHIDLFHRAYSGMLFKTDKVMAPYCYRCPFNRATPQRADAREYRKCHWECLDKLEQKFGAQRKKGADYAAFVFEPLIQGAAGMIPQPAGWLQWAADIARSHKTRLLADEVMTGFGRTGFAWPKNTATKTSSLFACHKEGVQPDFLAVAKGFTGGYLPMAATLTTQEVFDAFLGEYHEFKTFFHGHSFTGNQLGAAAALTNLRLLRSPSAARARWNLEQMLRSELSSLWEIPIVGDIRQVGLIVGIELVKDWHTRATFDLAEQVGIRVCEALASKGVLTRPIGNVIVLMPPYCTSPGQLKTMIVALRESLEEFARFSVPCARRS